MNVSEFLIKLKNIRTPNNQFAKYPRDGPKFMEYPGWV